MHVDEGAFEAGEFGAEHFPGGLLAGCGGIDVGALLGVRRSDLPAVDLCCGDGGVEAQGELGDEVTVLVGAHDEFLVAVLAVAQAEGAEDVLGVLREVFVDVDDSVLADLDGRELGEVRAAGLHVLGAALQNEQVHDRLGARRSEHGAGGHTEGGDEVGAGGDLSSGAKAGRVHRVVAGEKGDDSAAEVYFDVAALAAVLGVAGRCGGLSSVAYEIEGLENEVVVRGKVQRVVPGVDERDLVEGHVADAAVEVAVRETGVDVRLLADVGVRVEVGGDLRADRIEFDPCDLHAAGSEADEGAGAAARLDETHPWLARLARFTRLRFSHAELPQA